MFKKLLSNLPFNPSLIGQVSFYAKRMRGEERIRRVGLFFVILAMFVQFVAVFNRPEPTLAASANDIIYGGFSNRDQATLHCLNTSIDFNTILAHFGITCDMVATSQTVSIRSTDYNKKLLSLGRLPYGKPGERPVSIQGKTYYQRYLWGWDTGVTSTYTALKGTRADGTPFMILFNCGNITVVESAPPPPPKPVGDAVCKSLIATPLSERSYRFKATTSGSNYTVSSYTFDFGDGNTKNVRTTATSTSTDHTYKATNTYTAMVKVYVNVANATPASQAPTCTVTLKTNTPDVCPDVVGTQATKAECDVCPDIPGTQSDEAECKPCDNSSSDNDVTACLILSKTARNNTQKIDNADGTVANGGDSITYTLRVKNTGKATVKKFVVEENIADVLDYADVVDFHGGKLGDDKIVRWAATDVSPNETVSKQITIKIKNPIPSTPISTSNAGTFDMTMTNVYGNTVNIKLPPTVTKTTEQVVNQLPNTGPGENLAVAVIVTIVAGYFFARARLFRKELDIVRTDYATTGGY